jgi:hypothetical protein
MFYIIVGFEVLPALVMKSTILRDITPCSPLSKLSKKPAWKFSLWFFAQLIFSTLKMEAICCSEIGHLWCNSLPVRTNLVQNSVATQNIGNIQWTDKRNDTSCILPTRQVGHLLCRSFWVAAMDSVVSNFQSQHSSSCLALLVGNRDKTEQADKL